VRSRGVVVAAVVLAIGIVSRSCARMPELPFGSGADMSPPVIVSIRLAESRVLRVEFDEEVVVIPDSVSWSEAIGPDDVVVTAAGNSVDFRFGSAPSPAVEHYVEAQVSDGDRNHLRFAARFHGLNELLPAMVINEFTTQGSRTHPDLVEIRVLTPGNTAGACVFEGTSREWSQRVVLPSIDVEAGDYIVVHFKPEGLSVEIDETTRMDESGGIDATGTAWDLWVPDGTGLSGNNGVISLYENPLGGLIDAVLYSNRTSSSDERYRGFGSTVLMDQADEIVTEGHWIASGTLVAPEDAVNPEPSTSTRSMARSSDSVDTNRRADWHVTPTRGLSPGAPNTDKQYQPAE
jgi:hypothetical protein